MRRHVTRLLSFSLSAAAISSCSESVAPRGPGAIAIKSTINMPEPLFFEFGVSIDNGTPHRTYAGLDLDVIVTGLAHGKHTVALSGTPTVCSAGTNVRDVTLTGDDTATVLFSIQCARTTGDVNVSVATTGPDPDPNGYLLRLNGQVVMAIPSNGMSTIRFLVPGTYTLSLSDVASNCTASGAQSVTITPGAAPTVSFAVTCVQSATVKFVSSATGADMDADGYDFQVGPVATRRGPPNGTTFVQAGTGTFSYAVADVQPNCIVSGGSGSITVAAGDTATVTVSSICAEIGFGALGTSAADPAGDTLPNGQSPTPSHDVTNVSVRYTPNFAIIVLRASRPMTPAGGGAPSALFGYIEIDTDENVGTGFTPSINAFGGSAVQGVDYVLYLFGTDSVSTTLYTLNATLDSARVPTKYQGDSVIFQIPLGKLGGDDGRFTVTNVVGTQDRPTDIAPNAGQIVARPPGGAIVAGERHARPAFTQPRAAGAVDPRSYGEWVRPRPAP